MRILLLAIVVIGICSCARRPISVDVTRKNKDTVCEILKLYGPYYDWAPSITNNYSYERVYHKGNRLVAEGGRYIEKFGNRVFLDPWPRPAVTLMRKGSSYLQEGQMVFSPAKFKACENTYSIAAISLKSKAKRGSWALYLNVYEPLWIDTTDNVKGVIYSVTNYYWYDIDKKAVSFLMSYLDGEHTSHPNYKGSNQFHRTIKFNPFFGAIDIDSDACILEPERFSSYEYWGGYPCIVLRQQLEEDWFGIPAH